jgi:NAD-dependent deacetylase
MHDDDITRAGELISRANSVTVLTGAGVSAESGVPTFRDANGLWKGASPTELASPEGFARDPRKVWEWYNLRRRALLQVRPNAGHMALADLERRLPEFGLITQNVDRLHQAAGSKLLLELHGNIWDVQCSACGQTFDRTGLELPAEPHCPDCSAWLRPGVVWFGEQLPAGVFEEAERWTSRCDVFLVVGTSAVVWPAAGLIDLASQCGAKVIELNPAETAATSLADVSLRGKSAELLPRLFSMR